MVSGAFFGGADACVDCAEFLTGAGFVSDDCLPATRVGSAVSLAAAEGLASAVLPSDSLDLGVFESAVSTVAISLLPHPAKLNPEPPSPVHLGYVVSGDCS